MRTVVAGVLVVLCAGVPAVASHARTVDVGARVDTYLDQLGDELSIPGLAVAVIDGDAPPEVHLRGNDGDGRRIDVQTPFLIGSVAKSMTATVIEILVRSGSVRLSERVGDRLPWSVSRDATVEQLLTHTGGFTAADGLAVSERFDNSAGAVRGAAHALHRSGHIGRYEYSDANYLMLGALVEDVTGRPYGDVLRTSLLGPLGMNHSAGSASDVGGLPAGHRYWWDRPVRYDPGFDGSGSSYGYVVSTIGDMITYARAQMGRAPAVLDPSMLAELHRPRVASGADHYGFGWRVDDSGALTVVHHTGATPGYFAHVMVRSDGVGVVVLANAYSEARAPVLAAVAGDVLAISDGEDRTASSRDGMLWLLPWVLASVVGIGVLAACLAWRRPRRRGLRAASAVGSLVVVAAAVAAPSLLGVSRRQLWIWAPDSAVGLVAAGVVWSAAAMVLMARPAHGGPKWGSGRSRVRVRAPEPGAPPTRHTS